MFRPDPLLGVVEDDGVALDDINRADAEASGPCVEEVEIDQLLQRLLQRGGVIQAQRLGRARSSQESPPKARTEKAQRPEHCGIGARGAERAPAAPSAGARSVSINEEKQYEKTGETPTLVNPGGSGGGSVVRFPSVSGAFRTNRRRRSVTPLVDFPKIWRPEIGASIRRTPESVTIHLLTLERKKATPSRGFFIASVPTPSTLFSGHAKPSIPAAQDGPGTNPEELIEMRGDGRP